MINYNTGYRTECKLYGLEDGLNRVQALAKVKDKGIDYDKIFKYAEQAKILCNTHYCNDNVAGFQGTAPLFNDAPNLELVDEYRELYAQDIHFRVSSDQWVKFKRLTAELDRHHNRRKTEQRAILFDDRNKANSDQPANHESRS